MQRMWSKIKKTKTCWLWIGSLPQGYGRFKENGKSWPAHRYVWTKLKGPIPESVCLLHKCDVRNCVRPKHLFLGSRADNNADMMRKKRNRQPKGEQHHRAKLTNSDIIAIRKDTRRQIDIAADYGVKQHIVSRIKRRKIWRHI